MNQTCCFRDVAILERFDIVQLYIHPWEYRKLDIVERLNTVQAHNSHPWEYRELAIV